MNEYGHIYQFGGGSPRTTDSFSCMFMSKDIFTQHIERSKFIVN